MVFTWHLSALFFPRCPQFTFIGSPAKLRGPGHEISASYVLTSTYNDEQVKIHCVPGYISQLYLVEYPVRKHFMLLDCGCPSDYERIKFYIEDVLSKERGVQLTIRANLRLVVSSHCHIDHCGAAMGYHAENVPLVRPTHMETSYQGVQRRVNQWFECFIVMFVALRMGRRPENTFWYSQSLVGPFFPLPPPAREVGHGDSLPFGFEDWVAVKVPGHTTHMIGLYHTPSRIFYAADTVVKLRKGLFSPNPIDFPWAYMNTVERLRKLDVGYLLMAHGGIVDIADQYGSWNTALKSVIEHYRDERLAPMSRKRGETTIRSFLLDVISRILRSVPVETRRFTRADLDTGAMPNPWPNPVAVSILDN